MIAPLIFHYSVIVPVCQHRSCQDNKMSKLSPALKALIAAPFARAGTTPAPRGITEIYKKIGQHAESKSVERPIWLAMAVSPYSSNFLVRIIADINPRQQQQ